MNEWETYNITFNRIVDSGDIIMIYLFYIITYNFTIINSVLFNDTKSIVMNNIYFNINYCKNNTLYNDFIISFEDFRIFNQLENSVIYNLHIYLPNVFIANVTSSNYGLLSHNIISTTLIHIGIYFDSIQIITGLKDNSKFGFIASYQNNIHGDDTGLFVVGNSVEYLSEIYSFTPYIGNLISDLTDTNVSYSFAYIKNISFQDILDDYNIGGIFGIINGKVKICRCFIIIENLNLSSQSIIHHNLNFGGLYINNFITKVDDTIYIDQCWTNINISYMSENSLFSSIAVGIFSMIYVTNSYSKVDFIGDIYNSTNKYFYYVSEYLSSSIFFKNNYFYVNADKNINIELIIIDAKHDQQETYDIQQTYFYTLRDDLIVNSNLNISLIYYKDIISNTSYYLDGYESKGREIYFKTMPFFNKTIQDSNSFNYVDIKFVESKVIYSSTTKIFIKTNIVPYPKAANNIIQVLFIPKTYDIINNTYVNIISEQSCIELITNNTYPLTPFTPDYYNTSLYNFDVSKCISATPYFPYRIRFDFLRDHEFLIQRSNLEFYITSISNSTYDFINMITTEDIVILTHEYLINITEYQFYHPEPKFSVLFGKGNDTLITVLYSTDEYIRDDNYSITLFESLNNVEIYNVYFKIVFIDKYTNEHRLYMTVNSNSFINNIVDSTISNFHLYIENDILFNVRNEGAYGLLFGTITRCTFLHVGVYFNNIYVNLLSRSKFGIIGGGVITKYPTEFAGIFIKGNNFTYSTTLNRKDVYFGLLFAYTYSINLSYCFIDLLSIYATRSYIGLLVGSAINADDIYIYKCFSLIHTNITLDSSFLFGGIYGLTSLNNTNIIIEDTWIYIPLIITGNNENIFIGCFTGYTFYTMKIINSYVNMIIIRPVIYNNVHLGTISASGNSTYLYIENCYIAINTLTDTILPFIITDVGDGRYDNIIVNLTYFIKPSYYVIYSSVFIPEISSKELVSNYSSLLNNYDILNDKIYYREMPYYNGIILLDNLFHFKSINILLNDNQINYINNSLFYIKTNIPRSKMNSVNSQFNIIFIPQEFFVNHYRILMNITDVDYFYIDNEIGELKVISNTKDTNYLSNNKINAYINTTIPGNHSISLVFLNVENEIIYTMKISLEIKTEENNKPHSNYLIIIIIIISIVMLLLIITLVGIIIIKYNGKMNYCEKRRRQINYSYDRLTNNL